MEDQKTRLEELLLDFHLDQLDEKECAEIRAELLRDAGLRGANERLGQVLRPLDSWTVSAPPTSLCEKVLERVEQARQVAGEPVGIGADAEGAVIPFDPGRGSSPWLFSMRELLAIAACLFLVMSVMVPTISKVRSQSQEALFANHSSSIHEGEDGCQPMAAGLLPFGGGSGERSWLPAAPETTSAPYASNSRPRYVLLWWRRVPGPTSLIRPTLPNAFTIDAESIAEYHGFAIARSAALSSPMPIAVMSDDNSLLIGVLRRHPGLEAPDDADDAFMMPGFPLGGSGEAGTAESP